MRRKTINDLLTRTDDAKSLAELRECLIDTLLVMREVDCDCGMLRDWVERERERRGEPLVDLMDEIRKEARDKSRLV